MALGDVIVDRALSNQESRTAVAELFCLRPDEVLVINDMEELLRPDLPTSRVLVKKWEVKGCFRTALSFHEGEFMSQHPLETAKKLCKVLKCRCLMSDDSVNPYSMIMVDPDGGCFFAHLDADKLDDGEEYEVDRLCRME